MAAPCKHPLFKKCSILGLGLMGGSIGLALEKHCVVQERWGYDLDAGAMREAGKRGAVDKTAALPLVLQDTELVILSAPVRQIISILGEISCLLPKGALVTDLGSTKYEIVRAMETLLPAGVTGIGGHPMAGSEKAGVAAAHASLLEDAVYILTPTRHTPQGMLAKLQQTVRAIGAHPLILEAQLHDRLAALVSHLPQLLAVALVNTLGRSSQTNELPLKLAAKGFCDTTRIAMGEPAIWYDIFDTNKECLKESLQIFMEELISIVNCLDQDDEPAVKEKLRRAGSLRHLLQRHQFQTDLPAHL